MIVVDTHAAIWDVLAPKKLSSKAKKAIESHRDSEILLCEMTLWEIAMLVKKKRLDPGTSYEKLIDLMLQYRPYRLVGITPQIASVSANFDQTINADPVDRIIAATSIYHQCPLVTADSNLRTSDLLKVIW